MTSVFLDWLGVSTFRLTVNDIVIFLDAYIDRNPTAPPVGLRIAEVDRARLYIDWTFPFRSSLGCGADCP